MTKNSSEQDGKTEKAFGDWLETRIAGTMPDSFDGLVWIEITPRDIAAFKEGKWPKK